MAKTASNQTGYRADSSSTTRSLDMDHGDQLRRHLCRDDNVVAHPRRVTGVEANREVVGPDLVNQSQELLHREVVVILDGQSEARGVCPTRDVGKDRGQTGDTLARRNAPRARVSANDAQDRVAHRLGQLKDVDQRPARVLIDSIASPLG